MSNHVQSVAQSWTRCLKMNEELRGGSRIAEKICKDEDALSCPPFAQPILPDHSAHPSGLSLDPTHAAFRRPPCT